MPKLPPSLSSYVARDWPHDKDKLLELGRNMAAYFCVSNCLPVPVINSVDVEEWPFDVCAYYRPEFIKICLHHCGKPCGEEQSRNWTWPASTTDREPFGVIAHELGHHLDYYTSAKKGSYGGDFSINLRRETRDT